MHWRHKAVRVSLYALLLSLGAHALLTLPVRVQRPEQGCWTSAPPVMVWITRPRKQGAKAETSQPVLPSGLRFAVPPKFPDTLASALDSFRHPVPSPPPLLFIMTRGSSHGPEHAVSSPKPTWRWQIELGPDAPSGLRHALENSGQIPALPPSTTGRPVVFSLTMVEPGRFRSVALAESSGDPAFDQAARAMIESLTAGLAASSGPRKNVAYGVSTARVAVTTEPAP